mmetsp:Transcript_7575/g.21526  ORF Transcript_7575/g.21526 Transcript_7575/m.21526 type:complete len:211 (-) Transcript_7575:2-634(-)
MAAGALRIQEAFEAALDHDWNDNLRNEKRGRFAVLLLEHRPSFLQNKSLPHHNIKRIPLQHLPYRLPCCSPFGRYTLHYLVLEAQHRAQVLYHNLTIGDQETPVLNVRPLPLGPRLQRYDVLVVYFPPPQPEIDFRHKRRHGDGHIQNSWEGIQHHFVRIHSPVNHSPLYRVLLQVLIIHFITHLRSMIPFVPPFSSENFSSLSAVSLPL